MCTAVSIDLSVPRPIDLVYYELFEWYTASLIRMESPYQSDSMRHTCDVCEGICNRMILNFSYYCKYGILVLVMTGQALLITPKGRNASRGGLVKLWEGGFLLFAILLHCEITTLFV